MRLEWSSIRAITKHAINYVLCDTRVLSPIPPFQLRNTDPKRNDPTQLHAITRLSQTKTDFTFAAILGVSRKTLLVYRK